MTKKVQNLDTDDHWLTASILLIIIALLVGGIMHMQVRDDERMIIGAINNALVYFGVLAGAILGFICGLISYFKNGKKLHSVVAIILSFALSVLPFIIANYENERKNIRIQAYYNSLSDSHWLYLLCSRRHSPGGEFKNKFISRLNNGADINATQFAGFKASILGTCIEAGEDAPAIIDFFIEYGADLSLEGRDVKSPLNTAIYLARAAIVEKLLDSGVAAKEAHIALAKKSLNDSIKFNPQGSQNKYIDRYTRIISLLESNIKTQKKQ